MTRVTTILAIVFIVNSLMLSYLSTQSVKAPSSLLDSEPDVVLPQVIDVPAADVPVQDAASDVVKDMPQDVQDERPVESVTAPVTDVPAVPED